MSETATWVANQIRQARKAEGLSQADLARLTGRTQAAVSLWESGKRMLGLDDLLDLARVLHREVEYFLPPERQRQPIGMLLRATAERIAGSELSQVVDDLLVQAEGEGTPVAKIKVGATTPALAAEELLMKAGVSSAPIPVDRLATDCGALVITAKMSDGLSGLVFEFGDGAVIAINELHGQNRQRFSLAHELGHYLLSHHDRFHIDVDDSDDPAYDYEVERLANQFAAELLMPSHLVKPAFESNSDTFALAEQFKVSELALGYRLINLGLR